MSMYYRCIAIFVGVFVSGFYAYPPVSEIESVFLPELNYIWVTVCV